MAPVGELMTSAEILALPGDELATLCLGRPREVIDAVLGEELPNAEVSSLAEDSVIRQVDPAAIVDEHIERLSFHDLDKAAQEVENISDAEFPAFGDERSVEPPGGDPAVAARLAEPEGQRRDQAAAPPVAQAAPEAHGAGQPAEADLAPPALLRRQAKPGALPPPEGVPAPPGQNLRRRRIWGDLGALKRWLEDDLLRERNTFARRMMKDIEAQRVQ